MLKNEGDKLTRVAVCAPRTEYFQVGDLSAHNIRRSPIRSGRGSNMTR